MAGHSRHGSAAVLPRALKSRVSWLERRARRPLLGRRCYGP